MTNADFKKIENSNDENSNHDFDSYNLVLPTQKKGRKSKEDRIKFNQDLKNFSNALKSIAKGIPEKVSSRGWCYLMENFRLINKAQFGYLFIFSDYFIINI